MNLIDVVKYNGSPNIFAWKFPSEELSTFTQLIVNESQEAILVKDGQITDIFPAGRYVLDTANIPILNKILNIPFGGQSPFSAEVWYINKAYSMEIKWGTPSPIQLQDPQFGIFTPVRARGVFNIKIENSEIFLRKLVGTLPSFDSNDIIKFFRGLYVTKVKDAIASYLSKKHISILQINAYLIELSEFLKEDMTPYIREFGIDLINFFVHDISTPEDDEGVKQLKVSLAKKADMNIVGYTYQQERSYATLEGLAKNTGSNATSIISSGLGMAIGVDLAKGFSKTVNQDFNSTINTLPTKMCNHCQLTIPFNAKFCSDCGQKQDITCPKCTNIIQSNMKYCSECGYNLHGGIQ